MSVEYGYRIERIISLAPLPPLILKSKDDVFFYFSLRTFEIFGCFNVSAAAIKRLGQRCLHLETLNLGQCYKVGNTVDYC